MKYSIKCNDSVKIQFLEQIRNYHFKKEVNDKMLNVVLLVKIIVNITYPLPILDTALLNIAQRILQQN